MKDENALLKKSLGELIAEQLRQDIYNRRIKFGERLIESNLAEKFDVSRSSIREALSILEKEELVTSRARKGTFVSEFTRQDLEEMMELRLLLEPQAFRNALVKMNESNFQHLESIVNRMKEEAEQNNWNALFNLDSEFHQYVIQLCGNSRIVKFYESLSVQIRVYFSHLYQYYTSSMAFYREHQELLNVLSRKDFEKIEEKIKNHITYVEERLLRKIADE